MSERTGQAQWILLGLATAIAGYLTWKMVQPFLSVLIWSGVLAILFFPVHAKLLGRLRRPALAATLTLLVVLATVVIPLGLAGTAVAAELTRIAGNAREVLAPYLQDPNYAGRLQGALDWLRERTGIDTTLSPEKIGEVMANASQVVLRGTVNVLGGVFGVVAKLLLVLFTLFYLFRDGEKIRAALPGLLPLEPSEAEALLARTGEIIHASVGGSLIIAVLQGALGGIMFAILGLPAALVWGVVMTLLSLLPLVGAFLVWIPAAAFLAIEGRWVAALVLAVWGGLVMGTVDNVLRPKLVGQRTRMHELTVFFSVLGGISFFGMLGFLVGPVVVAITRALFEVFRRGGSPLAVAAAGGEKR